MKNLKNILSIILVAIIILTATSTMAYSKTLDVRDEIQISTFISNEKGSIKIANQITGYSLYYQVNEMDSSTYKKIKQLEDELRVIQAFNMYEAAKTQKLYDEYLSTQIYYKNLYGTNVTNCRSQRADEAKSTIIYLLPDYKETWNQTTDNSFNVNLSSFSGTKDFVVWVQLIKQDGTKVYDAEVFELTGTKKETTNDNNGSNNNGSNNNGNSGSNNNGSNNNGNSGSNNNGSNNNGNSGSNNNGSSNNGNNSNNNGNNTSNNKIGAYMVGNDIVFYNDGINTYPLSIGQTVSEIAESNGVVYIRYPNGEIKSWATSNKTNLNLNTVAVNARSIYKVNGIVAGYYDMNGKISSFTNSANASETQYLNFQNGKVMLLIMQNGNIVKAYTLSDKNNKWASQDANNTCYVRKDNGDLYIWNYDLQKTESSVKLIKIASNVKDAIETKSNNDKKLLIGYTIEGSSAMQQALKLDDVKIKVAMAKVDNTANPTTDTNVTYAGRVVVKNSYTFLYNSNNEKVAKMKWNNKSKTLKYWNLKTNQTIKVKNVSSKRDYSLTGNPVFIKQNGEVFGISSKTMQVVRIGVGAVKFRHNAYGFATHYFSKGNQKSKIYF